MRRRNGILPAVAFALTGALLVWAASLLLPDQYTSTALIRLNVEPFPAAQDLVNRAWQEAVSRKTLKRVIERLNLYPAERERLPLEDVFDIAKSQDLSLDCPPDRDLLVSFTYRQAGLAEAAVNAILNEMVGASEQLYQQDPGWGRLAIKQAAISHERGSALAFWRERRYEAQGILTVKKAPVDIDWKAAERWKQSIRRIAFDSEVLSHLRVTQNLYLDRSPDEATDALRRSLRIGGDRNILTMGFTYPDPRLAQRALSGLITRLIDENASMPECEPPPSNVIKIRQVPAHLGADAERVMPDLVSPEVNTILLPQPMHWTSSALTDSRTRLVSGECHDPREPQWARTIDVLDPAGLPERPDGPCRPILAVYGFFLGLGLWSALKG